MNKFFPKKRYVKVLFTLLAMWFIYQAVSIRNYGKQFTETPSDVAIVLGAGSSNGKLSPVYRQRVLHAIHLLREHKVRKIIFTGGFGKGQTISDSQAAAQFALQKGIHTDHILIEETSTITFYNLVYARHIMDQNGLQSALLISDPYHMKRAMKMSEKIGIEASPSPTPTSMYRSRKTKFDFLIKETLNYCLYLLAGQFRTI